MAEYLARGFGNTAAQVRAGFAENSGNAHTKANTPEMLARVAELKEEYGIEIERRKKLQDAEAADIDEEWLLDKYRELYDETFGSGEYKVSKTCLDEIGAMLSLGDQNIKNNSVRGTEPTDRQKRIEDKPAIDIEVLANALKVYEKISDIPETNPEPIDITPEEEK